LARSIAIGSVCGAFLLPALFPIWVAAHVDDDFVKCCDGFGTRKRDIDHVLVLMLFVIWSVSITLAFASWQIPGAIAASMCVGTLAGAFLGYWIDQKRIA
jgi:hypothetical protein